MEILLTGAKGQLGRELMSCNGAFQHTIIATDVDTLDIVDPQSVRALMQARQPDLVINAAAYTAVDKAETDISTAYRINRDGPQNLASACNACNIPLIHVSTDFVFSGDKNAPYTEDDPASPLGVYGRSKAEGEDRVRELLPRHFILRTSWLYSPHGHNFVKTMLKLGLEKDEIRVVADQHGSPTSAADLARAIWQIVDHLQQGGPIASGTYHFCDTGITTWFGLAKAVFEIAPRFGYPGQPRIVPITTTDYPTPARRPAFSALDCTKIQELLTIPIPNWQASLEAVLKQLLNSTRTF